MSLRIVRLAARIEQDNSFHLARLLLLIVRCSTGPTQSIAGLTKLAKLDFFLRYPNSLKRLVDSQGVEAGFFPAKTFELASIESRMIRYRYGPWDKRYRKWLSILFSKGLVEVFQDGNTVHIKATARGTLLAEGISEEKAFRQLKTRCAILARATRNFSATRIKNLVYELFPEISSLQLGKDIAI